jgi:hypothetical protein
VSEHLIVNQLRTITAARQTECLAEESEDRPDTVLM